MLKLIFVLSILSNIQCDITNLNDFFDILGKNISIPMGFMTEANVNVAKRYLRGNIKVTMFKEKPDMLKALDNETIYATVTTGRLAQDLEPKYHVFSSLIISPQAMLVAPGYNDISTPYGLKDQSSNDLFDALNAAIADVQRDDIDETLLSNSNRTDVARVYSCHQSSQLPVPNRNETTGILRDILLNNATLLIGGLGPFDWGTHDGNYNQTTPTGFFPKLLDSIVGKLAKLKGPDELTYSNKIYYERRYFPNDTSLFRALLKGEIHATDVYILIDAPYNGTGESCSNDTSCRPRESCKENVCTHPARPRSLHFRTTCTTSSRDTKFITKKNSKIFPTITNETTDKETPKTRWIAFLLLFSALFGAIFLTLLIFIRRKKYYRVEHTVQGGFGKFARLREEAEPQLDGLDAFDDHVVQSPRDNTDSTN